MEQESVPSGGTTASWMRNRRRFICGAGIVVKGLVASIPDCMLPACGGAGSRAVFDPWRGSETIAPIRSGRNFKFAVAHSLRFAPVFFLLQDAAHDHRHSERDQT